MKASTLFVLPLLAVAAFGTAPTLRAAEEPLVLKPGVTTRGAKPETWQLDLAGLNREQAQAVARKLSSRLYGTAEKDLHAPLVLKTNEASQKVFGFLVASVAVQGATLEVRRNRDVVFKKTWPAATKTHSVNTLYYFTVPPGAAEIALEVTSPGVVVMDSYYLADEVGQLPADVPKSEAVVEAEQVGNAIGKANASARPGDAKMNGTKSGAMKTDVPAYKTRPDDGYRGIWFTLGQFSEHGDKYSGGLGTYTANHVPMVIYAPQVDKTFFTYGGTLKGQRHLLIMASYYDHKTGQVPRPVIVHDKDGVDDPHDNGSIAIDDQGYIWIFISGRGKVRPGFKYRSKAPYSIQDFELMSVEEMTYPQPRFVPGQGFFNLFTKYTKGRELYWETSPNGRTWSEDHKLAGLGGHYQVSNVRDGKEKVCIASFFNYHPGGDVDKRTNLYYVQTEDFGKTWTTVDGKPLNVPLSIIKNPALVIAYQAQGKLMYTCDLNFDRDGHPLLLYVTSHHNAPGPQGDPRELTLTRWDGQQWRTSVIATTDHNYDMGSLYVDGDVWRVIHPTLPGPQPLGGGGEMCLWTSRDAGQTWMLTKQITSGSPLNHNYARRPLLAKDPFFTFWADGDPGKMTESRLYFCDSTGEHVFQLPYAMTGDVATPVAVKPSKTGP